MKIGRLNIISGAFFLLMAALGGMALGLTFDKFAVQDNVHTLHMARFYLREGHSHGMLIALLNLIIGLLVGKLGLSDRLKKVCSWLGVCAFILPLALLLKGALGAPVDFPPIGVPGAFAFIGSAVLLLIGAYKMPE